MYKFLRILIVLVLSLLVALTAFSELPLLKGVATAPSPAVAAEGYIHTLTTLRTLLLVMAALGALGVVAGLLLSRSTRRAWHAVLLDILFPLLGLSRFISARGYGNHAIRLAPPTILLFLFCWLLTEPVLAVMHNLAATDGNLSPKFMYASVSISRPLWTLLALWAVLNIVAYAIDSLRRR